jgi:diaminopimelate epimerase
MQAIRGTKDIMSPEIYTWQYIEHIISILTTQFGYSEIRTPIFESIDVFKEGKDIADETRFSPLRTNVNFLELTDKVTKIATFERGVEAETLACGTGTVASAIVLFHTGKKIQLPIKLEAKGGNLEVDFTLSSKRYTNVFLTGPAEYVFKGEIEI